LFLTGASLINAIAYSRAASSSVRKDPQPKRDYIEAISTRQADIVYRPANAFQFLLSRSPRLRGQKADPAPERATISTEEFFKVNNARVPGGRVRYFLSKGYQYQQDGLNGYSRSVWTKQEGWSQPRWAKVRLVVKLGCMALENRGLAVATGYDKRQTFRLLVPPGRAYAEISGVLLRQGMWIRTKS
jgi:hypothetical protein